MGNEKKRGMGTKRPGATPPNSPGLPFLGFLEWARSKGFKDSDFHPQEIAESRFERTLFVMLRTPPDPRNLRTKAGAKAAKAKRKRYDNKAIIRAFRRNGKSTDVNYIFGAKDEENSLLKAVHEAVPRGINPAIRNDLCQDLLCAVIAGDIKEKDLRKEMGRYLKQARKFIPRAGDQNAWGEGLHSESWKDRYIPVDDRSMEERITDLADHWASGKTPIRKSPAILPKAKTTFPTETRASYEKRKKRLRARDLGVRT